MVFTEINLMIRTRGLEIIVSDAMKWERQCIEPVKKANKMPSLIKIEVPP